jgi:hypothetical protein
MNEPTRKTIVRRSDELKLELGDVVPMKDGAMGVVLARFLRSGDVRNQIHYIVELRPKGK